MDADRFVQQFFGPGNRFARADIQAGRSETHRFIRRWVRQLTEAQNPVVFPRWTNEGVMWYGIAQTEKQAQHLSEEVTAFVGPSYSTFRGRRADLDENDPVEAAVANFTEGRAFRFTGEDSTIREALHLLLDVRKQQPAHQRPEALSVGRLLRRFEMALRAHNRTDAEQYLQIARDRGMLDTANLLHLRVRLLAAVSAWDELLDLERLPDLLQDQTRPSAVRQDLIRAVYHHHLAPFEEDPAAAIEHFTMQVDPQYGPLFSARGSMQAPEVLNVFMMRAVSGPEVNTTLRDELIAVADKTGVEDPFFFELARWNKPVREPPSTPAANPVEKAAIAIAQGSADQAFRLLRESAPSPGKARALALLFSQMRGIDIEVEIANTLSTLSKADREKVVESHPILQRIHNSGGAPPDWVTWFERVTEGAYTASDALRFAEQLADVWSPAQLLQQPGGLDELISAIQNAPLDGTIGSTINQMLPFFLGALQRDPKYPRSRLQRLYRAVHTRIPYSNDLTTSDLEVYLDLSEMLLGYGISASTYEEILTLEVPAIWDEVHSSRRIDWLLDFAELLVLSQSHDTDSIVSVLSLVIQAIQKYRAHVEPLHVDLGRSLCADVGYPDLAADLPTDGDAIEASTDELCALLGGHTLGIYTLTESAGRRARDIITERCPNTTIHLRHDKHGNPELHRTAQSADYFLVVTRSATHSATGVIEQHVPTDRLIRPHGKGTSSMIRDLVQYARKRIS